MEEKLDRMFMNTTAIGEHAWAPSCGILPLETEEASMGDVIPLEESDDSYDSNPIEIIQAIKNATRKGKRRAPEQLNKKQKDKKGRKLGGAKKLASQIDRLVGAVESRSTTTSLMMKMQLGSNIPKVMEVVSSLPGCEPTSTLWMFTTRLFLNQEKREMFSTMKTPNVKLVYLKIWTIQMMKRRRLTYLYALVHEQLNYII
ncbi:hypothetical protein L3X38_033355 [Prunus dulcis]|uniref:Uncharacterized protein n=1 Tax=Prunus dulcis TaxID=3755 RepID=A0AAD4VHF7_PRUDU|nr:hypothetical protein L3X38_033355 [Prunus dulcis]